MKAETESFAPALKSEPEDYFSSTLQAACSLAGVRAAIISLWQDPFACRNLARPRLLPSEAHELFAFVRGIRGSSAATQIRVSDSGILLGLPIYLESSPLAAICLTLEGNASEAQIARIEPHLREIADGIRRSYLSRKERIGSEPQVSAAVLEAGRLAEVATASAGIAHEVNGPLAAARSILELLEEDLSQEVVQPERARRRVRQSIEKLDRMNKIIHGLQLMSRKEGGEAMEIATVRELVQEAYEFARGRFSALGVELKLSLPSEEIRFECRRIQITQVILNLMNNALDAMSGSSTRWIEVSALQGAGCVSLSIADCGPGIPDSIEGALMQPFFTTKGPKKGTGLGLYLSRRILERHHGALLISRGSVGASFTLLLPSSPDVNWPL